MKLTTKKLYQLIQESMVPDPDPAYAALYNPNQPMALLHIDHTMEVSQDLSILCQPFPF